MPTRNVVLTDHQAAFIDRLVSDGRYQNASEAIRAGLRGLEREETELAEMIRRADAVLDDADGGNAPVGSAADEIRRAFDTARESTR